MAELGLRVVRLRLGKRQRVFGRRLLDLDVGRDADVLDAEAFLRRPEAEVRCRDDGTVHVGDRNDRVVEGSLDVSLSVGDVLFHPAGEKEAT